MIVKKAADFMNKPNILVKKKLLAFLVLSNLLVIMVKLN